MRLFPLALLAACAGPTLDLEVPPPLPTDQVAPPPGATLPTLLLAPLTGSHVRARLLDVPSGASVFLLANTTGPGVGPCHPTVPLCAGLGAPLSVIPAGQPNSQGIVDINAALPPALGGGVPVWFQAVIIGGGGINSYAMPVELRVFDDRDGDFVLDAVDNCPDDPNKAQFDDDEDGFGAGCDCDDDDDTIFPGATDTPADFIDQDCDGMDEGVSPATFAGTYTGDADLALGGDMFNLGTFGLDELPCDGPVTITVNPAATPAITGSGSCASTLYGISGPAYPLNLESTDFAFRPSGDLTFLGGPGSWTGAFGTDGTDRTLTISVDLDIYGLTLTGTITTTAP